MRVIAGQLGGRVIRAPPGRRTRPTSDRVREALFSLLGDVTGKNVLDLYAGSGALGIEALSRGADRATFVESWSAAAQVLARNLSELELAQRSLVVRLPVERAGPRLLQAGPFDLVLCDPPWTDLAAAERALTRVLNPALLAAGARLVIEHPADEPFRFTLAAAPESDALHARPGSALVLEDTRRWGDTAVSLFAEGGPPPAASHRGL